MESNNSKLNGNENSTEKKLNFNSFENQKIRQRKIKRAFLKVMLMAMLLIVSTYAWFTSQKDITLSNIRGTVEVVENMEISLDAKTWYQRIDLSDAENIFAEAQTSRDEALGENGQDTKTTALTILPEQLFPVSGVGEKENTKILPLYEGEATSTSLSGIAQCLEEEVKNGKDVVVDNGYIAFDMYIKNTSRDGEADVLQLNINSSVQVLTEAVSKTITDVEGNQVSRTYTGNDAAGLQNTVRVGIVKYEGEVSSTSTQYEILTSTKDANIADIAIWEPNAYDHVETIVSNNNKLINGTNTEKIEFTNYHPDTELSTYALNTEAVTVGTIENVYNIASTGLEEQKTFKTDNIKWELTDNVEDYKIYTEDLKPLDIKNIDGDNFEISANTVTRYRVYVWLEGQDVDCINIASLGGGIDLDLGFTKDDEDGDVNVLKAVSSYSTVETTTGTVTAKIEAEYEIIKLPIGWTYIDESDKTKIQKVYSANILDNIEIEGPDGKVGSVEVKIENIDNDEMQIFQKQIDGHEKEYYGDYVDYPINIDEQADDYDWRIFYDDEDGNVYLISDIYLHTVQLEGCDALPMAASDFSSLGMTQRYTCNLYWATPESLSFTLSDSKFMLSQASNFTTTNPNVKAVGSLLSTSNWTKLVDTQFAVDAIGSPTIEMWTSSWNTVYDSTNYPDQQVYCNNYNENGYYLGTNENPSSIQVFLENHDGYSETSLYFPRKDIPHGCIGYWIASPSANNSLDVINVDHGGHVYPNQVTDTYYGVRPVICLNADLIGYKNGDVWELSN